ncbi:autophagy protein 5 [Dinochytrium kinnereticum]|nr:autophagy protein 5 [Dinochytrium kinnereticum]
MADFTIPTLLDIDASITRQVWDARIPACFSLDKADIPTHGERDALYLLIPRISYLPLLSPQIYHHFFGPLLTTDLETTDPPSVPEDIEVWFDVGGVPLRWHYPIGLLFDLHTSYHVKPPTLPWDITVHVSGFPADKVFRTLAANGFDPPLDFFMAQLKEMGGNGKDGGRTDFIRNGSTKRMMSLTKKDQLSLWNALSTNDHSSFWEVNSKLLHISSAQAMPATSLPGGDGSPPVLTPAGSSTSLVATGIRSVAVRVYWGVRPIVQDLVAPVDAESGL